MSWYYAKQGKQEGPIEQIALQSLIQTGQVAPGDLVWREGLENWKPAREVPELSPPPGVPAEASVPPGAPPTGIAPSSPGTAMMTAQPPPGAPYLVAPPPTNGLAIASMVCGIVSLPMCYVWALAGLPAVICGHMALKAIRGSLTPLEGRGMAIAGLATGYLAIAFQAMFLIFLGWAMVGAG